MGVPVPGGLVCKCEPTSKWESSRDNSCLPARRKVHTSGKCLQTPGSSVSAGAGETPLKCKPAPLTRRAGHGQTQPREGAFKDTEGIGNSGF